MVVDAVAAFGTANANMKHDQAVIYLHCVFEVIEGQSQVLDSRNAKETGTAAQG